MLERIANRILAVSMAAIAGGALAYACFAPLAFNTAYAGALPANGQIAALTNLAGDIGAALILGGILGIALTAMLFDSLILLGKISPDQREG